MSSSSSSITWNLERGCCSVKELLPFTHFLSKTFNLDTFHTLRSGLLSWQLGLPHLLHSWFVAHCGDWRGSWAFPAVWLLCPSGLLLASPSSEISASLSCRSPNWERRDDLFGTGGAACAGIQRRAKGGDDCDSHTRGLRNGRWWCWAGRPRAGHSEGKKERL